MKADEQEVRTMKVQIRAHEKAIRSHEKAIERIELQFERRLMRKYMGIIYMSTSEVQNER